MSRDAIPLQEFDRFTKTAAFTVKRVLAENTWLRHNFGELDERVAALRQDIHSLKTTVTRIRKSLGQEPTPVTKTRSKP